MSLSQLGATRTVVWSVAGLLALGTGVWGWSAWHKSEPTGPQVPKEFTVSAIKDRIESSDAGSVWESMRALRDRQDLTEEQREQIRDNMREVMEEQMQRRIDEYFMAPESDRNAILDKHIDEMQKRFAEWRARERPPQGGPGATGQEGPGRDQGRRGWGGRNASQAERKARSERRNPDRRAQRMAYFSAMRSRMQARGIQPPPFGRGGGGPRS
jgi:hypothetical protein